MMIRIPASHRPTVCHTTFSWCNRGFTTWHWTGDAAIVIRHEICCVHGRTWAWGPAL